MKKLLSLLLAALLCLAAAGCGGASQGEPVVSDGDDFAGVTLRLAVQYGMQYAPVYVMQELGYLEDALPGVTLEWNRLGGGSAMNEALISGSLDVAFMGIPPVLIAIDSGADYRVACGVCVPPAELMVSPESGITDLAGLDGAGVTIAVPSIGSIQHIMLAMACADALGNANALDDNLVAMGNADAYAAFQTGSVTAHFASMPYIAYEKADGMVSVLDAQDCGGGASIVCVCTPQVQAQTGVYGALMSALMDAAQAINDRDPQALQIIADTEQCTVEQVSEYLDWAGTLYTTDVYGLSRLGAFMAENGYLQNDFAGFDACVWDSAVDAG